QAGFHNLLQALPRRERITLPSRQVRDRSYPDATFDYILTSLGMGRKPIEVVKDGVSLDPESGIGTPGHASDHYLIRIKL
ncbi:MAG: hypothetical protein AAF418_01760, partial [Pseudomonadota bacterium]